MNVSGDLRTYWKKVAHAQDFHVRAVASQRRDGAILLGKHAISRSGGGIVDFRTFGDLALSMIVEVEGGRTLSLVDTLVALGWHVDADLDRDALAGRAGDLLAGTFLLIFPEGDGELEALGPAGGADPNGPLLGLVPVAGTGEPSRPPTVRPHGHASRRR